MFAPIFQRGPSREKTFRRNATSLFRWLLPRCSFLRVSCAGGILALGFRHPLRRASSPLALAPCKTLHHQDGLLDLLPLRSEFRNHLDDIHNSITSVASRCRRELKYDCPTGGDWKRRRSGGKGVGVGREKSRGQKPASSPASCSYRQRAHAQQKY